MSDGFIRAVRGALGPTAVAPAGDVARASANVEQLERTLPGVLRARTIDDVRTILALAATHGVSVAPWSRGRNWGYGTRLPPAVETYGLDLSAMSSIRQYDPRTGTVQIEPGVTQRQLSDMLRDRGAPHYLDVTGSSPETSVLGNTLDRGFAYNSMRADTLRAVEVLLPDGRLLQTGLSWLDGAAVAGAYRHGLGPNLTELFLQSNLGVVTAATLALRPVTESRASLAIAPRDARRLPEFVEALAGFRRRLRLDAIFHVVDGERSLTNLAPMVYAIGRRHGRTYTRAQAETLARRVASPGWTAVGLVEGTRRHVDHVVAEARRAFERTARVRVFRPERLTWLRRVAGLSRITDAVVLAEVLTEVAGLTAGRPSTHTVRSVHWPFEVEAPAWRAPEQGRSGWLVLAPLFPTWGDHVRRVLDVVEQEAKRHGIRLGLTVNLLTNEVAQATVSLAWSHAAPGAAERAHTCQRRATRRLLEMGYPPYRAALGEMAEIHAHGETFWQVARDIKQTLDPGAVIAPGRYIPTSQPGPAGP